MADKSNFLLNKKVPIIAGASVVIAIIIIVLGLFYSGSVTGFASKSNDEIVCPSPYILVGRDCCLDKNNNSICDTDDVPIVESFHNFSDFRLLSSQYNNDLSTLCFKIENTADNDVIMTSLYVSKADRTEPQKELKPSKTIKKEDVYETCIDQVDFKDQDRFKLNITYMDKSNKAGYDYGIYPFGVDISNGLFEGSARELALKLRDLSSGYAKAYEQSAQISSIITVTPSSTYDVTYAYWEGMDSLTNLIIVFETVEDAEGILPILVAEVRRDNELFEIISPSVGDEIITLRGEGYSSDDALTVYASIYRKSNVIVLIYMDTEFFGLSDMNRYAKVIENRIT
jgi:hypothetical protein